MEFLRQQMGSTEQDHAGTLRKLSRLPAEQIELPRRQSGSTEGDQSATARKQSRVSEAEQMEPLTPQSARRSTGTVPRSELVESETMQRNQTCTVKRRSTHDEQKDLPGSTRHLTHTSDQEKVETSTRASGTLATECDETRGFPKERSSRAPSSFAASSGVASSHASDREEESQRQRERREGGVFGDNPWPTLDEYEPLDLDIGKTVRPEIAYQRGQSMAETAVSRARRNSVKAPTGPSSPANYLRSTPRVGGVGLRRASLAV